MDIETTHLSWLNYIGLTDFHWNVILYTFAIVLVMAGVSTCYKFGVFKSVQFQTQTFERCQVIYVNHRGSYDNIGLIFSAVNSAFTSYFKISKMFGIYYDNPKNVSNPKHCRSTIGLIVNPGQLNKIQQFLDHYKFYKAATIPSTKCLSTYYPYVNKLSFLLIISKVYSKLQSYVARNNLQITPAIMEIYHFLSQSDKQIQILAPRGNYQSFMLWSEDSEHFEDEKEQ